MPFRNGVYRLPRDPQELQTLAGRVRSMFARRDARMRLDQRWYELREGISEDGLEVTLPTPAALVRKATAMIASRPPRVRAAARRQEGDETAQRIEDFLDWWRYMAERRYTRGVRNPLVFDEVFYLILRGWVVGRLLLNPDDEEFPFSYTLLDPLQVYPCLAGDRVLYVVHQYTPTVAQVLAEWPGLEDRLGAKHDDDTVQYTAFYTDHELAVLVDGQLVKPPVEHEYGFCPIVIGLASGAAYREADQAGDWTWHMGTGLLEPVRQVIGDRQKALLMHWVRLSKEADPPVIYRTDSDELVELDTRARGRTVIGPGEDVQPLKLGPSGADVVPLLELLQLEQDRASLGPGAFVDGAKFPSGFAETVAAGAAHDVLWPFARGLERYYEALYERVLLLYREQWPPLAQLRYLTRSPETGRLTAWNALSPAEIAEADVVIKVEFREITPTNEVAKAQIGYQAAQAHILDLATVRERYFDIDRPQTINERVLADLVYQNPQLIQALAVAAGLRSGNPYLVPVLKRMIETSAAPQEAPPPAGAQAPNAVLPDELGVNAGLAPGEAALGGPTSSGTINEARLPGT